MKNSPDDLHEHGVTYNRDKICPRGYYRIEYKSFNLNHPKIKLDNFVNILADSPTIANSKMLTLLTYWNTELWVYIPHRRGDRQSD